MSCDLMRTPMSNVWALPLQFLQRMALFFFSIHFFFLSVLAQLTQVPPLQWINLSNLLRGSSQPPPLRDAAMGYDDTRLVSHPSKSSLSLHFAVVRSSFLEAWPRVAFPSQKLTCRSCILTSTLYTYILRLNLETLIWSSPSPPTTLQTTPPPRSAAISGGDFAASKWVASLGNIFFPWLRLAVATVLSS